MHGCVKYFFSILITVAFICNISTVAVAQEIITTAEKVDTVKITEGAKKVDHRVRTATLMSTALPGLGQVYNHRIWKVPILYVLGTALGIFIYDNSKLNKKFKDHYLYMIDSSKATSPPFSVTDIYGRDYDLTGATLANVRYFRDNTERQRNLNIIAMAGLYVLNIIDAHVDAHLRDFEISENLSLNWKPEYKFLPQTNMPYYGLTLQLNLHHTGQQQRRFLRENNNVK